MGQFIALYTMKNTRPLPGGTGSRGVRGADSPPPHRGVLGVYPQPKPKINRARRGKRARLHGQRFNLSPTTSRSVTPLLGGEGAGVWGVPPQVFPACPFCREAPRIVMTLRQVFFLRRCGLLIYQIDHVGVKNDNGRIFGNPRKGQAGTPDGERNGGACAATALP